MTRHLHPVNDDDGYPAHPGNTGTGCGPVAAVGACVVGLVAFWWVAAEFVGWLWEAAWR